MDTNYPIYTHVEKIDLYVLIDFITDNIGFT